MWFEAMDSFFFPLSGIVSKIVLLPVPENIKDLGGFFLPLAVLKFKEQMFFLEKMD